MQKYQLRRIPPMPLLQGTEMCTPKRSDGWPHVVDLNIDTLPDSTNCNNYNDSDLM
jgi:hypothetical protein